jgi:TPR repeat protein
MTPEEIRKQMMGSAGVREEDADALYKKANAAMDSRDYKTAFKLGKRAADLGNLQAARLTGICFIDGLGVQRNPTSARPYIRCRWARPARQDNLGTGAPHRSVTDLDN